jgi:hypothetical protein
MPRPINREHILQVALVRFVREAVADILGVIAGATIEVQAPRQLTARAAELLGVDRDRLDRIADELNTDLHLGRWNEGRGFAEMIQEAIRIAIPIIGDWYD